MGHWIIPVHFPFPWTSYDSFNLDAAMVSAIITPPKTPLTATFSITIVRRMKVV